MMDLDTIMSREVITIPPTGNLETARALMHKHRIHHLPVVDGRKKLVGLVTLTDVLAATDSFLRDPENRMRPEDISVRDVMVTDVATVDKRAGMRQAALFLEKHRIGCLPVVSNGRLEGIITDTDFVGVAINLLEQLEQTEPDESE